MPGYIRGLGGKDQYKYHLILIDLIDLIDALLIK